MFEQINTLMVGGISVSFLIASIFFIKFWKKTGDYLFLYFACAFLLMCGSRFCLTLGTAEVKPYIYLLRLSAFLFILWAMVQKNLPQKR
jgi:hypothetical protein